jgi:hypothetical protein
MIVNASQGEDKQTGRRRNFLTIEAQLPQATMKAEAILRSSFRARVFLCYSIW